VKDLYTAWIKIDETLPWIELKGEYQTKKDARRAANDFLKSAKVKITEIPEKRSPMKPLASVRISR